MFLKALFLFESQEQPTKLLVEVYFSQMIGYNRS